MDARSRWRTVEPYPFAELPPTYHNLVTQTQDPTNSPDQRDQIEQVIFDAVKKGNGEVIQYNIKPIYEGTNPIPIRLDFTAFGNKGFTFTHSLENPAAGVRTGV
ncbi:DNA/RNA non-specific endonuclease [Streptomyces sp. NPDC056402]|uniref:DNA/RNA non-specific endonuclease n=1 Tax=Streptomyces sp. NPDC056402 TaxID=3345810 RepID=UPI0035DFC9B7